jgi:hypothetical protein
MAEDTNGPDRPASDPDLVRALVTACGLPAQRPAASLDDLRRVLAARIADLLQSNRALLLGILFRIDVPEEGVIRAFTDVPPDHLPAVLAEMMIERQWQKLLIRGRFSPPSHPDPPADSGPDPA